MADTDDLWALAGRPDPDIDAAQLWLIVDTMPTLAWIANADGYITWYNRRWHDYCGTTPAQMEGWGWQAVHDPVVLPRVLERWTRSIATGAPFEMTFPLRGGDGVFRPFLTRAAPLGGPDGTVVRWVGTNVDVSSEAAAEVALARAKDRAEAAARETTAILAQLAEGVIVSDAANNITYVNDAAVALHGVTLLDPVAADYARKCHLFTLGGAPHPPHDLPLARAVRGETVIDARWRIHRPDGSAVVAVGTARPLVDDKGQRNGAVLTIRDDTARADAESRLVLSEQSLRLATDAAEIGIWDLDLTTGTLTWSDRTRAMFGMSAGAPCSMADFYGGLHAEDLEATSAAFAAALDPEERAVYDVVYRTVGKEDGVVRWIAAKGRGVFDSSGQCLRAIGTAIDVTRNQLAATCRAALAELDQRLDALGDAASLAQAAAELLGSVLGVGRAGYGIVDLGREIVTVERDWFAPGEVSIAGEIRFRDYGGYIEDLKLGRTVAIADATLDPGTAQTANILDSISARAFINQPVLERGRAVALLYLAQADPREWTPDELAFVAEFAERVRVGIERRRAEMDLRASEARLRAVVAAAPVGLVFGAAPDGRITGGNARAEQLLRHPVYLSPDVEHYREWIAFHADGRRVEGHEYPLARALAGEELPELEVLYRRGDGSDAYVCFVAAPVRGPEGAIVGGVVASLDVDQQRRTQMRQQMFLMLADRTRGLSDPRAIVAATVNVLGRHLAVTRVGFGEVDADARAIIYEADHAEGVDPLLGSFPLDRFGTKNVADLERGLTTVYSDVMLDERTRDADFGAIQTRAAIAVPLIRDRRLRAVLYVSHRKVRRWTQDEVSLVEEVAGRTWDSLERARAEAELRDLNATLERRVEERTAELSRAEEALRQAHKMEAVGQLTGGIAHDFNNMLSVVLGSLDLLDRRLPAEDARAKRYVDAAAEGARRAAALTQRLLAFSRQQPLQPEAVDVNRLVAGMSDLLRHSLGGSVKLESVLAGGLWPVHADPNQLENIILNLGINARDAMPEGGRVTIETHNAHLDDRYVAGEPGISAGQYVMIAVTDAGVGMTPDVIAKAFDPFFTTKGVGKGTGLGLSQVYGFVKQSGGHVKIYSEVGQGTTVKLYLPRLAGHEPGTGSRAQAAGLPRGESRELILVVEDERAVRAFTVEALGDLGYRVLQADGAAAALRLLEEHADVTLLFTDVVMPEVNGAKLAEAARALRPGLKVLFTTGYTRNAVVHNGVVDPGVALIGKPFTIEALAAKVRHVLDAGAGP